MLGSINNRGKVSEPCLSSPIITLHRGTLSIPPRPQRGSDKYYRSENHKREVVGTGLGLSIVKEILKMHNYNYGVNSKLGEGSTFWFEIRDIVPPDTAEQPESEIQ